MTHIDTQIIRDISQLSRIALKEEEIQRFTKDLQSIISFIDRVNATEINSDILKQNGFAPINNFRNDVLSENDYAAATDIINSSPRNKDNAIQVKKIITE